jgi:uncharacterized protein YjbI with pentapeptide repeats
LRGAIRRRWCVPFIFIDWLIQWAAFALSKFSLLELLEYCGSFSILFAVVLYFAEAPQRQKMRHYQAWQLINTAQGNTGNGGRVDALEDLNNDHVSLVNINVTDAALEGLELPNADLRRAIMHGVDLKDSKFIGADLESSLLSESNFYNADLTGANLSDCKMVAAYFMGATLRNANLSNADFDQADLTGVDFTGVANWKSITHFQAANIHGVRNAPDGFVDWAKQHGAVDTVPDSPTTQPR